MRRIIILAVLAAVIASCGVGYESENRTIVAELPVLDQVGLIEEDHYGYCSQDSCRFGNDRSGALLLYSVDTDQFTQRGLVDAYRTSLPNWDPSIQESCANAEPSFCDEVLLASFSRGAARIDLNLDNWSVGRFELHVDAQGGP